MGKLFAWFKKYNFRFIHFVLLIYPLFMLMWPKIPFKTVDYTYVAIRYEDFFLAFVVLVFFIDLIRRKATVRDNPLRLWIPLYWFATFIAFLYGFYAIMTVKTLQLGFLNSARRVEYMIIFFIAYAVLENKEQFALYLKVIFFSLFVVVAYALGQKFLGWPAFLTMNDVYARGILLYLTEDARITSMFGGHYDLAAYMVIMIPMLIAALFINVKRWTRASFFVLYVLSLLILAYTVSRVSFIAYVLSTGTFILFVRKWKFFVVFLAVSILLLLTSDELTTRFLKTLQIKQILVNNRTGEVFVPQTIVSNELPAGSLYIPIKTKKPSRKQIKAIKKQVIADSQMATAPATPATTTVSAPTQPKKPLFDNALITNVLASLTNVVSRITTSVTTGIMAALNSLLSKINVPEISLPAIALPKFALDAEDLKIVSSVLYDISSATRFQVEWPRAIDSFRRNLLLGTGPSSITEATDNDYLRALGETGILGFSLFFFIIAKILAAFWRTGKKYASSIRYFFWGVFFAGVGLLINATYIDIFEASKIAFFIWFLWGLCLKATTFSKKDLTLLFKPEPHE